MDFAAGLAEAVELRLELDALRRARASTGPRDPA